MKDVLIIGGGPAGLTAGIYAGRAGLSCQIIERMAAGGQAATTAWVENYPGFLEISGWDLAEKMAEHAKRFGADLAYDDIHDMVLGDVFKVQGENQYEGRYVIIATGAGHRMLGVPGEKELLGSGVSYCATCDGHFFKDKTAVVVGGGDTAAADALYLAALCKKVYVVHRRDKLRAAQSLAEKMLRHPAIEILWNTTITKIEGQYKVESLVLNIQGQEQTLLTDGVFIAVGTTPNTGWLKGKIPLTSSGHIKTDENMQTALSGVYAVGDVRQKPLHQILTAAADGAVAIHHILLQRQG